MSTGSRDRELQIKEGRIRNALRGRGLALRKDTAKSINLRHLGGYRVIDPDRNCIVGGSDFELSLADVKAMFLKE
jgi:hypothetical protein